MNSQNPLLLNSQHKTIDVLLPTKGLIYQDSLSKIFEDGALYEGKVKISELTTKDELLWSDEKLTEELKTPIIILNNIVKGLKRAELLARVDVEYLLLIARKLTYGDYTEINWECDECGNINSQQVLFDSLGVKYLESTAELILNLDNFNIYITPLRYDEAVEIKKLNVNDNIAEQLDKIISCIQYVDILGQDGNIVQKVTDKRFIAEWVENMNPRDFQVVLEKFEKVNKYGVDTIKKVRCQKCNVESETEVFVDISNFFSKEDGMKD